MRKKITVVGAGNVGASCALWLAQRGLADIVLVDAAIAKTAPVGKSLDLLQAGPIVGYNARITGTADGNYDGTENSDVIVITAGFPRKPGMSREDLVGANQAIITDVIDKALPRSPNAFFIVVTNPLDSMAYLAYKHSQLPKHRVMGQAGILDSARMAAFIALEMNVSIENVQTVVLGGHGDEMVPLTRYSTVFGRSINEWLPADRVNAIIERTRKGGGEIVNLLKTGSAFYAPAASAIAMAESYLKDQKRVLPCAAYLNGAYGVKDMFVGVPVVIGAKGVERIVKVRLNAAEKEMMSKSIASVQGLVDACKTINPALAK